MPFFTTEESVITLYFSAYGITSDGVAGLLKHKCGSSHTPEDVYEELVVMKAEGKNWDRTKNYWNWYEIGKYIAKKIKTSSEFEKLTFFGDEEEAIVNTKSQEVKDEGQDSGAKDFVLKEEDRTLDNNKIFHSDHKETILHSVRSVGVKKGIMNHITLAYYFPDVSYEEGLEALDEDLTSSIFGIGVGSV